MVEKAKTPVVDENGETDPPAEEVSFSEDKTFLVDYSELYAQNSDMVGWIKIEDTNINYPVVQSVNNPDFYLKHGFDKSYSDYGCPYVQENCDVQFPSDKRAEKDLCDFCICDENDYLKFADNNMRKPVVVVLKKNGRVLRQWKNNFASTQFVAGNPLFIVDDEADAASLNTQVSAVYGASTTLEAFLLQRGLYSVNPVILVIGVFIIDFFDLIQKKLSFR